NVAPSPSASVPAATARLDDGTTVSPLGAETSIAWRQISPSRVVVGLDRGRIRCEVHPNPARVFRVEAGNVTIEVLGTAFDVERLPDETVRVSVDRGLVRVTSSSKVRLL